MAILSKGCKPNNFESQNSLKLSFMTNCVFCSNFVECEAFVESNSPDILALCETNLDESTDFGNFSVVGYVPLIWKDSITHMHGFAVYVKEGLPFAWDLSLESSADSYLFFWLALLHSMCYFFFLYQLPFSSLCTIFDSISSNIVWGSLDPPMIVCIGVSIPPQKHHPIFLANPHPPQSCKLSKSPLF